MCDANQSVIAELIAIIGSSLVQVLMQHHKLAFAIGYTPDVELDIPTVFVQMMVELLLEMIVDSTVMWAEGEHGIPITRYFEHVRSLHVAGNHMAASIMAVTWVIFSFIRFPTIATCASSNACECLDKPQFEAWFANECNQTAANQTSQDAQAKASEDMFKNVDGFTIIIAIVTGIAMAALIWLSVMFSRYRKRNKVVGALEENIAVAQRESEEVQANLEEKLHDLERDADEALRRRAQEAEAREGALLLRAQSAEARAQDALKQKEAALSRERLSNEMRKSVRK